MFDNSCEMEKLFLFSDNFNCMLCDLWLLSFVSVWRPFDCRNSSFLWDVSDHFCSLIFMYVNRLYVMKFLLH